MQEWFDKNDILMYSHNERHSVIFKRFIKTFKAKIYIKNSSQC